ncbi:MAG: aspartate aminotransferase family protein [Ignavibacteriae bacterium]|nr:MAG: aspartate aminotransferase family protein [Ignavibacteriota bacterium]
MKNLLWYPGHELVIDDIVKAYKCYLFDSNDKKYIDFESGVWCTSIGHNHPRINKVIEEQIHKITHTGYCYSNNLVKETADEILSLLRFEYGMCTFLCSGSEAIEYGVRIAQQISNKPLMLTFTDSYFGAYGSASKKSQDEWYCIDWIKYCESERKNYYTLLDDVPFERIGGFLFEPGSSSGLVRFPPQELLDNIIEKIHTNNGLVIVNEVTTGIGRTGEWFGFQHYKIKPDIVTMGKGLGNGYPVSVTAVNKKVADALKREPIKYAQSHQNDVLGAVIAREVIRIIKDEKLIEHCRFISNGLFNQLNELKCNYSIIKEIRGRGLMIALEFIDRKDSESYASIVRKELLKRGFIVAQRYGTNVLRIDPALTVKESDVKEFIDVLEEILKEMP